MTIENPNLLSLLEDINLSKTLEERLLKNTRTMDTIGRPIELRFDQNYLMNVAEQTKDAKVN